MTDTPVSVFVSVRLDQGTIPLRPHATVTGSLDFEGLGAIVALPDALTIEGDLLLRGTSIEALPPFLTVRGRIDLEGCKSLTTLSENLNVGGDLDLELCHKITNLPHNLIVGGNLYLAGTRVCAIPLMAVIRGEVYDLVRG
jgi:hypothetical protein